MKNIAFLGIGAMGERIATNLINAGYQLQIWNRTAQRCQSLVAKGATAYDSPKEAVRQADIAIAMVTDNQASCEVWLERSTGAIHGLKPNTITIESSTLTPAWCRELAQEIERRNCHFLDAPVVGSRPQAEERKLIYLVGGQTKIVEQIREILAASSTTIHHIGEVGTGMTMKLAVNTLFGIQVAALSETLAILNRTGVSEEVAVDLLNKIPTTSPALKGIGTLIKNKNHTALFPIDLVAKDFYYSEQLGQSVKAKTPTIKAIRHIYQEAVEAGYGRDNISGIARLFL